jgi:hypothetical protein
VTTERYTAVFTGFFMGKKPGEYLYLSMGEEPLEPEGGCTLDRGRPRSGREIRFEDLPERCRHLVLDTYRELWGL